ncbi:hypothetical protein [Geothermobacter hydrogeniphilus]|uniref:Uncharacterized protein n=1 Tax=Geothermobacter hydrogeniphilus TaxID=1969733 RepID=A0A1X0XL83_9BACT|nr:hypothetical protein [Geothermobacter hydrogeniphilus]ORJ53692.1 hypothetical protein B5V00_16170 [Geothermobacter hydrogeniphilus]
MRFLLPVLLLVLLPLFGCSVSIVPQAGRGYQLNKDNSLTAEKENLKVTVGIQELEVAPYRMVDNITSFKVTLDNGGDRELLIPLESFVLVDGEGQQYRPIAPAQIQQIVKKDSNYLIPYPYVGYYYLEDKEKSSRNQTFESARPFYAENYPQDIFTQALPVDAILPGAKISGLLYFVVELTNKKSFELRLYLPGTPSSGPPDFSFPFSVEKN